MVSWFVYCLKRSLVWWFERPFSTSALTSAQALMFLERESLAESNPVDTFGTLIDVVKEANRQFNDPTIVNYDLQFLVRLWRR